MSISKQLERNWNEINLNWKTPEWMQVEEQKFKLHTTPKKEVNTDLKLPKWMKEEMDGQTPNFARELPDIPMDTESLNPQMDPSEFDKEDVEKEQIIQSFRLEDFKETYVMLEKHEKMMQENIYGDSKSQMMRPSEIVRKINETFLKEQSNNKYKFEIVSLVWKYSYPQDRMELSVDIRRKTEAPITRLNSITW